MIMRSLLLAGALVFGGLQAQAQAEPQFDGEAMELHDVALRDWFPRAAIVLSPTGRTWTRLPNCGGSAELDLDGDQVNIVFRNVENCSKFDILSAQGESINYGMKNLNGRDGRRRGSFTLPQRVVDWGRNGVMVQIRSNSGKTMDKLYLDFYAF